MPPRAYKISRGTRKVELTYNPMVKQAQAHGLVAKYRGFCGGWGNGKTSFGCAETFARLHEYPGTRAIVARKTRPELKSTTWDMLVNGDPGAPGAWTGIPKETIASINVSDMTITFRNKSIIYGLPLDDPAKLENFNLGFFWIDQAEEIEEDIFLKFHGRLRQRIGPREGILTYNPNGHNWLWRRFIDPNRPLRWNKFYKVIEATTFDNVNLPEDYLEQFEGLPESWIQRYIYGSHEVFVGQIFTDWDPAIHVIPPFRIPLAWERWMCIDPGIRHEAAVSWMARDPLGNWFYYREHLEANRDVSWWADKIRDLESADDCGGPYEQVTRRLIGPEAQQRQQGDGKTVLGIFQENGIFPEIADRDPGARISKITQMLRPRKKQINPMNGSTPSPKMFVFDSCKKLQEYLPQYRWVPVRVSYTEEDAPERPRKKDDHNIDNLGHIVVAAEKIFRVSDERPPNETPEQQIKREMDEAAFADADRMNRSGLYHPTLGRVA
jgi:hypothetical protein